jgi:2-dehydro-3-deoxygalactonokinase
MNDLCITLDGGTTNTRATLVRGTNLLDTVSTQVGVRDSRPNHPSPVLAAVSECLNVLRVRHGLDPAVVPVIASGMIGSDAGLVNVPHLMAPASAAEAARHLHPFVNEAVWPRPICIIPGVRTGPDKSRASSIQQSLAEDIMRGEETQVWGLWLQLSGRWHDAVKRPWVLLWPGSHTKLIAVGADGSVLGSFTTLAGELFAALKSATLLARSLPNEMPVAYTDEIIAEASQTVQEYGLMRAAFWTRVADVTGRMDADQRAMWLSAAVIAADVQSICRHPWLNTESNLTLFIGGDALRRKLYEQIAAPLVQCQVEALSSGECDRAAAVGAVYVHSLKGSADNEYQ